MNTLKRIRIKKFAAFLAALMLLFCNTGCDKIKNAVIDMIPKSSVSAKETVCLTFPEGSTVSEFADILDKGRVCSAEEFMMVANNTSLLSEYGFEIESPENRAFALEGYLFPDTYEFYVGEGAESAARRFLKNTQKKLDEDIIEQCAQSGFSLDEILTIASIIQEETGYASEMKKVSSVLHNRLASKRYPRLQCDATTFYLENSVKPFVSPEEYEIFVELYSSYKCEGVPEGPITNPGIEAIQAALNPEDTSYYFFISDSENVYHYAETYEEHLELCAEAGLV